MKEYDYYSSFLTEGVNEKSLNIDKMSSVEIVKLINDEDKKIAYAVETQLDSIAKGIDLTAEKLRGDGRLIYIGAGTSGRLSVVDACEIPPTYGYSPQKVQAILAGGNDAMFVSSEGGEDDPNESINELKRINFNKNDVLFRMSASGSARFVIGALEYAKSIGALTLSYSCREDSAISKIADIPITVIVGPEVINGSTRMKAATAQKMVLTMFSTGVMVKLGRVRGNMMVYMNPANIKLVNRGIRIVMSQANVDEATAKKSLEDNNWSIVDAIDSLL